jgi:hypothetical protein
MTPRVARSIEQTSSDAVRRNIKAARVASRIDCVTLARRLGIAKVTMYRKLSGRTAITIDEVSILASAMDLERWDLFRDETEFVEKLPHLRRLKQME